MKARAKTLQDREYEMVSAEAWLILTAEQWLDRRTTRSVSPELDERLSAAMRAWRRAVSNLEKARERAA